MSAPAPRVSSSSFTVLRAGCAGLLAAAGGCGGANTDAVPGLSPPGLSPPGLASPASASPPLAAGSAPLPIAPPLEAPPVLPAVADDPPLPPPPPAEPHLYARRGLVRIHEKPDRSAPVLGAFRAGQAVRILDASLPPERTLKKPYGCTEGWYPVAPRGFACAGGPNFATRDANDPTYLAAKATLPDFDQAYPYRYGVSVGTPQYLRIPTPDEQRTQEPDLDHHLAHLPAPDPETGAVSTERAGHGPPPEWLAYEAAAKPELVHADEAYDGYKIAFTREFDAQGRTWLLTPTMTLVPKDRVRLSKTMPTLQGIDLKNSDLELPLAFFWLEDTPKWVADAQGSLVQTEERYRRHSFVPATMNQARGPKGIYWKLGDGGHVPFKDATIIRPSPRPAGVRPDEKWVEVRVTWGFLIAYEGDTPVYATVVSPGADGIAKKGHTTAVGRHYVDWKLYTGDMSGRDGRTDWFIEEVPWVQYYKGNYAFHGAFWHNDFGRPRSHGCVNLAPADARALFSWMDPVIPEGWYAASSHYPHSRGTFLLIRH
ncbi:MAG: L,D-transpeptidase [Myxococcota bacterium]